MSSGGGESAAPAGGAVLAHLSVRSARKPAGSLGLHLPALAQKLGARLPDQRGAGGPGSAGVSSLPRAVPRSGERVVSGAAHVQGGGQPVLYEHVHQHHADGSDQSGPLSEDHRVSEGLALAPGQPLESGDLRSAVERLSGDGGAYDRADRGKRGAGEVFPVQAEKARYEAKPTLICVW